MERWSGGSQYGRTYGFPPFVVDGPDTHFLVGCESVSWVGFVDAKCAPSAKHTASRTS
jgi:hypothetical protein